MSEQCKEDMSQIDKRDWEGCIAIARDLLEFTLGVKIHGADAIEEQIYYRLGKDFKDAAYLQGNVSIEKGA